MTRARADWLRPLVIALTLAACDEGTQIQLKPEIRFPDADGGRVPYLPGGALRTYVSVSDSTLTGAVRARVELAEPVASPGPTVTSTITLVPTGGGTQSVLEGEALLTIPSGGPVKVRATVAGFSSVAETRIDTPSIGAHIAGPLQEIAGAQIGVPICVESTASDGVAISVGLSRATLVSGADSGTFILSRGACDGGMPAVGFRSSVEAEVIPSGASFAVTTSIVNAPAVAGPFELSPFEDLSTLYFVFEGVPASLPDAGTLIDLTVTARVADAGVPWLPFSLETIPTATVVPTTMIADATGQSHATVVVPNSSQLHVDAVAGAVRNGITLSR